MESEKSSIVSEGSKNAPEDYLEVEPQAKAADGSINPAPISTVLNGPSRLLSAGANATHSAVRLRLISSQRGLQLPVI